jgi:beta-glucanase (GH16 family)
MAHLVQFAAKQVVPPGRLGGGVHMQGNRSRMRLVLTICTAVAAAVMICAGRQQPTEGATLSGVWSNVWTDTFNGAAGTGVDSQYWKYDVGQGRVFGNNEVEQMTDSAANVHLTGTGDLAITALNHDGWTSGRIQTRTAFTAPAGGKLVVSASIEQPAGGDGYWPAFWMLGQGQWPEHGEIDILEDVNSLSEHSGTLHCGNLTSENPDGTTGPCHEQIGMTSHLLPCDACQTGYHIYSVTVDRTKADDEQIIWELDGRQFFTVNEAQVGWAAWNEAVNHGFSIIFDLAIGGTYPDDACKCVTPNSSTQSGRALDVQYVKVQEWTPSSLPV